MPEVYRFRGFPRQFGFVVEEDQTIDEALTGALRHWAAHEITKDNLTAYIRSGHIEFIDGFTDTDKGWEDAMALERELLDYGASGNGK